MHLQTQLACTLAVVSILGKKVAAGSLHFSDRIESESESKIKSNQVRNFQRQGSGEEDKGKTHLLLLE